VAQGAEHDGLELGGRGPELVTFVSDHEGPALTSAAAPAYCATIEGGWLGVKAWGNDLVLEDVVVQGALGLGISVNQRDSRLMRVGVINVRVG